MRPFDPRLAPLLRPAAPALGGVVVAQVAAGALLVAQAFTLGALVTALLGRPDAPRASAPTDLVTPAAWFAGVTVLRAVADLAPAPAPQRPPRPPSPRPCAAASSPRWSPRGPGPSTSGDAAR